MHSSTQTLPWNSDVGCTGVPPLLVYSIRDIGIPRHGPALPWDHVFDSEERVAGPGTSSDTLSFKVSVTDRLDAGGNRRRRRERRAATVHPEGLRVPRLGERAAWNKRNWSNVVISAILTSRLIMRSS